jgi:beta-glucosidase-like glycosyl hydrolase
METLFTGPENPAVQPFAAAISEQGLTALMLSHVISPSLDENLPVTLSALAQQGFLREKLGFRGIILTDDINMKALTQDRTPEEAAVMALAAGADMIMYLNDAPRVLSALVRAVQEGRLCEARVEEAVVRIIEEKLRLGLWLRARELTDSPLKERLEEFGRVKKEGDALARSIDSKNPAQ